MKLVAWLLEFFSPAPVEERASDELKKMQPAQDVGKIVDAAVQSLTAQNQGLAGFIRDALNNLAEGVVTRVKHQLDSCYKTSQELQDTRHKSSIERALNTHHKVIELGQASNVRESQILELCQKEFSATHHRDDTLRNELTAMGGMVVRQAELIEGLKLELTRLNEHLLGKPKRVRKPAAKKPVPKKKK